jgi:hypothetical protein
MKYLISFLILFFLSVSGCAPSRLTTGYDINAPSASGPRSAPQIKPAVSPPAEKAVPAKAVASFSDTMLLDQF